MSPRYQVPHHNNGPTAGPLQQNPQPVPATGPGNQSPPTSPPAIPHRQQIPTTRSPPPDPHHQIPPTELTTKAPHKSTGNTPQQRPHAKPAHAKEPNKSAGAKGRDAEKPTKDPASPLGKGRGGVFVSSCCGLVGGVRRVSRGAPHPRGERRPCAARWCIGQGAERGAAESLPTGVLQVLRWTKIRPEPADDLLRTEGQPLRDATFFASADFLLAAAFLWMTPLLTALSSVLAAAAWAVVAF